MSLSGEKDIDKLLQTMAPELSAEEYVFCSFAGATYGDFSELQPIASVSEQEALTLVLPKSVADKAELDYDTVCRAITLTVHSSLEAVGLTAAVATSLAEAGISANVIAGFYHDHIFVPASRATQAVTVLEQIATDSSADSNTNSD